MITNAENSAFAVPSSNGNGYKAGLTKREYIAAMVMGGLASLPDDE